MKTVSRLFRQIYEAKKVLRFGGGNKESRIVGDDAFVVCPLMSAEVSSSPSEFFIDILKSYITEAGLEAFSYNFVQQVQ